MKKQSKISRTAEIFLEYDYTGDGKYYLTEQGSRAYRHTNYSNFRRLYPDCIEEISSGNDAPRGGRTGDYVIVKFTPEFFEKFGPWMEWKKQLEAKIAAERAARKKEIEAIGDQAKLLREVFIERPDRLQRVIDRIRNNSNKKWRNWVRLKAAKWVANGRFDLLTLSAPDIRDIAFDMEA